MHDQSRTWAAGTNSIYDGRGRLAPTRSTTDVGGWHQLDTRSEPDVGGWHQLDTRSEPDVGGWHQLGT